ncbi:unnamed protein product [Peronospora belbahrii]|uniref:Uncharacterized protein n=1 Tax=Peronospora belbahrii TaxID=622444 RepID=A0ABN8CYN2_9STRA|nr:unnamed protein product [Peronospora belbahrii]
MGLNIKIVLQQKTRWVASKLSLQRLRSKKRSRMETTELRPIALAGDSRCFTGSSTQCNPYARTPSVVHHEQWKNSLSKGDFSVSASRWKSVECASAGFRLCV